LQGALQGAGSRFLEREDAEVEASENTLAVELGDNAFGGFEGVPGLESMVVLGQYGVERWDAATDAYTIPPEPAEVTAAGEELPEIRGSGQSSS